MKKTIIVGLAILAASTAAVSGKSKSSAMKPKTDAPAAAMPAAGPFMGQTSAADMAMYKKNQHDSGMKK
jgi:hypothetical protein